MTDLMHYEKGCSPSEIQRKYSLTYEQGYELAERLKKTQELELELRKENTKLKELLKECRDEIEYLRKHYNGIIDHFKNNTILDIEISQALGEEK